MDDVSPPDPDRTVRLRLDLGYHGAEFTGWAEQPGLRTVQGELQRWITSVLRLTEPARVVCAGRTDAGVHARGQVVHVDLPAATATDDGATLLRRLNRALPDDLVVIGVRPAPPGFDARFAADWRQYCYRVVDGPIRPDPLGRQVVAHVRESIDLDRLNAAAATLLGLRDFGAFCRRREGATTIRTLLEFSGRRVAGDAPGFGPMIELTVRADAFCHSMVRSLVGAVITVGTGRRDLDWLTTITGNPARDPSVPVMPAQGLTLEYVHYPPDDQLAARVNEARSTRSLPVTPSPEPRP
ncbi:tRNA pseudouridine(38-40) synthase TruA [Microlunatus speluncae]|uniref:tRNA pseudouridine(38-40) synthase TruA n=1 Tax=Microlunatus speluncae TaxID=2594267 RepID=UPI00126636F5|nr:tRNA pseudouridine(38-40) synthase TruA [Microlunatus speluncae]